MLNVTANVMLSPFEDVAKGRLAGRKQSLFEDMIIDVVSAESLRCIRHHDHVACKVLYL